MRLPFLTSSPFLVAALVVGVGACTVPGETGGDDGGTSGSNGVTSGSGGAVGSGSSGAGAGNSSSGSAGGSGTLIINEIMYDPKAVGDSVGEYLELYNPGSAAVDLMGWTLRDEGNNSHVIGTNVSVPAGGYAVLARSASEAENGGFSADYAYGDDLFLANGGSTVALEDAGGQLVDSVVYGTGSPWPNATAGTSIELSDAALDNALGSSWAHAVLPFGAGDRGTPGKPNGGDVGGFTVDDTVDSWHQPALKTSVMFAPFDDLESHVLQQIGKAKSQVRLAFFNIRLDAVKDALVTLANSGVDVHVILDKKQQDLSYNTMGAELVTAGVTVTQIENTGADKATMHNKFAVIDGSVVMTGSANYSYTALNVSDEDLLTVESSDLAQRYLAEFDELIADGYAVSDVYPSNTAVRAFMGPEDNLDDHVEALLDGAQSQALVAMFDLNASSIVDAMINAHGRGVQVVAVLDKAQADDVDGTADETLIAAGVDVILADNTGSNAAEMHSKFLVVDQQQALVGSLNWTNMGAFYNDENIVVIDDAHMAARVAGKFAQLVDSYGPSATSLGLVTGPQSITFNLSNVTLDPGSTISLQTMGGGPFTAPLSLSGTSVTTEVPAGTPLKYRYTITNAQSGQLLESGSHSFTVPYASGPFTLNDAFVK
jgi:phosphatidylserine/phosphatidylglycerophosphate/cardiolipin synthase-like enzyme